MISNISGFPEFLPNEQIAFNHTLEIIKNKFELYGFSPLDTVAVEKISTLLSKGNDNEIYGIYRLAGEEGNNKKDLALRFDLTVPLARYVSQNHGRITFPYKRHHIAPVWRGERPQAGRYRQFYQCDIDIISDADLPLIHDSEMLAIIYETFKAMGLDRFIIKINNSNLLAGLIESFDIKEANIPNIMRIIDKAEKISRDDLKRELFAQNLSQNNIDIIFKLIEFDFAKPESIAFLRNISSLSKFQLSIDDIEKVINEAINSFSVPAKYIKFDPSLARGLNYYTGTVYETKLLDYPELGAVCSGGRYNNLVGSFINKNLPGIGISIGISRIFPKLIESGLIEAKKETIAQILVTSQNKDLANEYIKIAQDLRNANIKTELFLSEKALSSQMKYASKKGFEFVVIADKMEIDSGKLIIRDMISGEQKTLEIEEIIKLVKNR